MPPKVLVLSPGTIRGGCEEYALMMADHMRQIGCSVTVALPQTPGTASLRRDVQLHGLQCERWRAPESAPEDGWGDFDLQRSEAIALIDTVKPDSVLLALPAPNSALGFIAAAGARGIKGAATFQLCTETVQIRTEELARCAWARQHGMQWVAVCHQNVQHIAATFRMPSNDITVIHNRPQRARIIAPDPKTRQQVRLDLGIPRNAVLAITVGRLAEQKGHRDILAVATDLVNRYPLLHFLWVGTGELASALRRAVRKYALGNRIKLAGYRDDVPFLLAVCDLFIFPSHWEGSPFALGEAMAAACPVAASRAGGNPELLRDMVEGVLFDAGNRSQLRDAVAYALDNSEHMQAMAKRAARRLINEATEMTERTTALLW